MPKKRIVICSDGTWNTPDSKEGGKFHPSNVVKVAHSIASEALDGTPQVVCYDEGLGTHWGIDHITGGAFGQGISKNIKDAYRFLVNNYSPGDEIYLFGFSRGALTVRSTAGFIRKCGILRQEEAKFIDRAYELYKQRDESPDTEAAVGFRREYAHKPQTRIRFIGVWDTVGSLGIPTRGLRFLTRRMHEFHDAELSRSVDFAYHALAIDEKRGPFRPTIWKAKPSDHQVVEQVWFVGAHSDVGGGYTDCCLSDVAFEWMVEKAKGAGLDFNEESFTHHHLEICPDGCGQLHNSKTGLYRLTRSFVRPIAANPQGHESVHPSVKERHDRLESYRPESLIDYWKRNPELDLSHQPASS